MPSDAQTISAPPQTGDQNDWSIVVLPRQGKPPLRVRGRQITHHVVNHCPGSEIAVTLWQRPKAGYVLAYSTCAGGTLGSEAIGFASAEAACAHLEGVCARLSAEGAASGMAPRAVEDRQDDVLRKLQHAAQFAQLFPILVGEALAAWSDDGLMPPMHPAPDKKGDRL